MDDKYFNAGVIAYDLTKYHEKNLSIKLEQHLFSFNKEAKYWDQDILNSFFNGQYLELDRSLNNSVALEDTKLDLKKYWKTQQFILLEKLNHGMLQA